MQRKYQVVIFYKSQEALDRYLYNFSYDKPIKIHRNNVDELIYFEYEHFEIKCFKRFYSQCFRGLKCDLIAVEKILTESYMWSEFKNNISPCMLTPQRFKDGIQMFE